MIWDDDGTTVYRYDGGIRVPIRAEPEPCRRPHCSDHAASVPTELALVLMLAVAFSFGLLLGATTAGWGLW